MVKGILHVDGARNHHVWHGYYLEKVAIKAAASYHGSLFVLYNTTVCRFQSHQYGRHNAIFTRRVKKSRRIKRESGDEAGGLDITTRGIRHLMELQRG